MSLSVIDKYVEKKKKDILEYAKILESLITLEDNKMCNNRTEFSAECKEIIAIYADKYYFLNNTHRDNPIEYLNDNINNILQSIIEYCKTDTEKQKMLNELKNETFLLSVIICTSCYLDIATNVIDGNFPDTKNKFKYLLSYLKKTKILKVYASDRIRINDLFDAIKKNAKEDGKFFEYYESPDCTNEFIVYTQNPLQYLVKFKYNVSISWSKISSIFVASNLINFKLGNFFSSCFCIALIITLSYISIPIKLIFGYLSAICIINWPFPMPISK